MKRTVCFSRGTVVPPEVMRTTRRFAAACNWIKSWAWVICWERALGGGLELKYWSSTAAGMGSATDEAMVDVVCSDETGEVGADGEDNQGRLKESDKADDSVRRLSCDQGFPGGCGEIMIYIC